ncbi:helicase DnaB [Lactococcus garvieae subsp. garvieae]|jgi:replication initiation and membrane attachment protein|uniref:Replication protein DnaB n=1 Tax=Lactococcus garvieae TRF1 TaxID=1380772 RepID=V8ARB3_9LACT|nr:MULTISPECIES: DnaD domain protein [Lactococcus]ETD04706.1 replication protein DnaB [Lactococcus garvieae TRF1]KAA8715185.1 helicase DnaB [Lactococcus garvieae subsp. garvieae]KKF90496.1 helicase DnaB [Lactococcus garvieae]MCO7129916.1 DnaD domain protein [Lactococcus garvieae]MDB7635447.1 DnaD domain protein [Lactococcus garvieae]
MRPGDSFSILNRGKISFDADTFSLLYLPIIGRDAFGLYQLLRVFSTGKISHFLEYLDFGLHPFIEALDKLSGIGLVRVFDQQPGYLMEIKSPLTFEEFLADEFYKQLLVSRIGENKVKALAKKHEPDALEITKKFHEVYSVKFEPTHTVVQTEKFDLNSFKSIMENQHLTFANENQDILTLYGLAEKFDLNWYELFKAAEQTANADKTLNTANLTRMLAGKSEPLPALSEFPKGFQDLIVISKEVSPRDFLNKLKQQAGGFASQEELKILNNLDKQNITDQVQNILIHYVLIQQGNASLNARFVNTLANDWLRHKVYNAETAVKRILERQQQAEQKQKNNKNYKNPGKLVKKAPQWSNASYVNTTSAEDIAKFEQYKASRRKDKKEN